MKCEICNRTASEHGINLHRVNELGVKGIWRCTEHLTDDQSAKVDPEVREISEIINPPKP